MSALILAISGSLHRVGAAQQPPAFAQGVDFRNSLAYVTDPTGCDFYNGNSAYPVVGQSGQSFGWASTSGINRRDRSTTVDPRLAGVNFLASLNLNATFQMSLPAPGTYRVRLALGDLSSQTRGTVQIMDGATVLATLMNGDSATNGQFYDATGVLRTSAADWVANNAPALLTFTGSMLSVAIATPASAGVSEIAIAHLWVESA